jgi:hypothetical protein
MCARDGRCDIRLSLQVERFIKQACVDKQAAVSSAALVSGLQLLKKNNDRCSKAPKSKP